VDAVGWCIANLHTLLGHDKAAAVLGVPAGDRAGCLVCAYEADPSAERRRAVVDALAVPPSVLRVAPDDPHPWATVRPQIAEAIARADTEAHMRRWADGGETHRGEGGER
jgi:hypothetical protein